MSPIPCNRSPDPARAPATGITRRHPRAAPAIAAALLLLLAGCAYFASDQIAGCDGRCRDTKERCDDNARWEFRQCEAGYASAQSNFLWCNSGNPIGTRDCGYPWWSCSENLYGYCTNRFRECQLACRNRRR